MGSNNNQDEKATPQPIPQSTQERNTANPMKNANPPQMPTMLRFSQLQNDYSNTEDDSE